MSRITNIIILPDHRDWRDDGDTATAIDAVDAILADMRQPVMKRVDDYWHGPKCVEHEIYIGGFNYLDLDTFLDRVAAIDWQSDDSQVLVRDQEQVGFEVTTIRQLRERRDAANRSTEDEAA